MSRKELYVAIPHYKVKLPSGEYVLDAYFVKEISYLPRRALLIYPTSVLASSTNIAGVNVFLEGKLTVREVYEILCDTYDELRSRLSKDIKRILHRSRLSVLIPMPRAALGEIDSETRSALIILDKVFSGSKLRVENDVLDWSRVHVVVHIKKVQGEVSVKAPHPIPKIYEWLYRADEGFRKVLNEVIEGRMR